ncbi:ATP-binding protein [Nonomuraea sp. MCN248]|uniref:ATP-binding protein n=1 Tax=Nonomuraea corallina TaxID=2989783 RepID=A0ABT4S457_9ACTN|nr:ATP-binding protein [Nonomuraea corallina]MDA0631982.1 ATP-binding protein [Nonomuraea corallina]
MRKPPYSGVKVWSLREIPGLDRLPGLARQELREWMGPGHPALDDLTLIASELVTNAIVHVPAAPWVRMSLNLTLEGAGRHWRLAVTDPGGAPTIPVPRTPEFSERSGRGLWIVDDLTGGCWGTHRTRAGERVVWALVPR